MYVPFSADPLGTTFLQSRASTGAVTQPEDFGPLVELEQIGTRRCFNRDEEIFAEGDVGDCWYRVVSGTVRICKLLRDGRRHVAQFCFADDCFGLPAGGKRVASFLVELSKRYDTCHILVLPMTRSDIADYLGLTIETVCRELSAFKRYGIIASTSLRPDRIELRDCKALEALCEVSTQKGAPRWHTREEISA